MIFFNKISSSLWNGKEPELDPDPQIVMSAPSPAV